METPNRAAFLRIAAGGRLSCSAMASRVLFFASSISSRSDLIDFHSRSDSFKGHVGPRPRLQPDLDEATDGLTPRHRFALGGDPLIDYREFGLMPSLADLRALAGGGRTAAIF
jgi:hypothetical protein